MRADLLDPALAHDHDAVGALDGDSRWTTTNVVRPCGSRASACWTRVSERVSSAEVRLVQEEHLGVADQGPGDGEPLPLPAGQPRAVFADQGVEAPGKPADVGPSAA
ncbi:predicted protein [Streptomyces viridochromogenes DSM 40736]|uniref:Predicted protein n=1 Tax=Streptomyces viridochromogenes (strain DSM 40736 / JCM 4977 / BCRC 1201 / Tue 494) TaxID=591159 RepID=D9XER5_STRVT|nr:predicted protein [Streptomyces viridochromogenes DSM 40736]